MAPDGLAEPLAEESLRRLGRYRVEHLVGSGRTGAVFLGRDPILGRPVALKVIPLRPGVHSGEREERLDLLAGAFRHLGGLAHPNLVTVFDAGIEEESAFLVTEFVPGADLEAALAGGPLAREAVLDLGRDLAAGLDYAHAAGGVHGDLRPGSVLLQPSGAAKVVDFGIAGALAASRLSHAVSLWDDPTYLAPEALTGGGGPAADLWALALLLYRALTGALPFDAADPAQLLEQIEGGIPRPPSTRDASLRPAVDLCFDRALDKRPEARFPSCEAFVAELAAALAEPRAPAARALVTQPLDAGLRRELTAAPIPRRAIPPARRRSRWPRLAALLAGLALGLGAGLGAMFLLRDGGAPPSATPAPSTAASPVPTATPPAPWGPPAVALPPPSAPSAPPTEPELRAAAPRSRSPAAEPTGTGETTAIRATVGAPATTRYGTLRVRLASEVPAGRLTVLLDSEPILTERFRFGGPFAFLRRRPRGGQLQLVRQVPAQPATLTVRLELGDRLEVVPLSAVWTEALELTLAIEVNAERGVTATLS